jgi:hypothetical protein
VRQQMGAVESGIGGDAGWGDRQHSPDESGKVNSAIEQEAYWSTMKPRDMQGA